MPVAIQVDKLSKMYRIGAVRKDVTLREQLMELVRRPFSGSGPVESLWALRDVSFSVEQGEVVGVIGRNGAGKSTLLKILSKITWPTTGSVRVEGRIASLLEVGTGFHDELTGRENIYLNGSILGMKKREVDARFEEIVEFSGVARFLDTPIKRYSSGMKMRLGFAVAAHLDPDILVVDEVLAVGDAGFQKKCLNAMESLRSGGRTVLFVSHNMAAVENLCSRGVWLEGGTVKEDGPATEIIRSYMGTFAAGQAKVTDLTSVTERRGDGALRFAGFELLDDRGLSMSVVRSGDFVTLRFHYTAETAIPHPVFGFRLFTEYGTLVTMTGFWHYGIEVPLLPAGKGTVDATIPALNLLPSRYVLSLWITGSGGAVHDIIDNSAVIDVEAADLYGSGRVPDSRFGIVYLPQSWSINGRPVTKLTTIDATFFPEEVGSDSPSS
jgi:homopolymeric O-antigen transport system ATP-binding protein